ncbi:MAG: PEGA domain-containing protein, partial [Candidatus Saccharibacteria bacterium]
MTNSNYVTQLFYSHGYFALTALVIVTTVALVAYGQGYSYDLPHNRLVHNGLVIISTQPSGATVKVESKSGTKKSPYHATFEAGDYRFHVIKNGFEPWQKVLHVIASQVTLAEYIILLPIDRPATIVDRRVQITNQTISRDHRHMAYLVPGAAGGLYTLDLTSTSNRAVRLYQPAAATPEIPAEVLSTVSWSDDASHLLLGSTLSGASTVRLVNSSDGTQTNLTDKYHFDFTSLVFSGRDWRQLYWISPDGIRRLDAGAQTVTGILADKASRLIVAGDRILYIQTSDLGESLGSLDSRDHKQTIVQALVKSPSYDIKYE